MRLSLPPLEQSLNRGFGPFRHRGRVYSAKILSHYLESELADLTQRFTILDQKRAIMEANHVETSSRADDLALRLLEARSFIHSTLSQEYGRADEPKKPQLAFRCLQAEVAKKDETLRVATTKVGTLQALLNTERQGCTLSPSMEKDPVHIWHSYGRLKEIAKIWALMQQGCSIPILWII